MSSSVSGMVGRCVARTVRAAAKIPYYVLDANHTTGACYYRVDAELGEPVYTDLCRDSDLILEAVLYCQEELGTLGKSLQACRQALNSSFNKDEQKKRLINHDYLLLKIRPGIPDEDVFYIKAEKLAGGDSSEHTVKPGIHISVEVPSDHDLKNICLYKINCGVHLSLCDIRAILSKHDPNYNARDQNCWDYAKHTTKWLLEACMKASSSEQCEEYWRLHSELDNFEKNLCVNHILNNSKRAVNYLKTHVVDKLLS